MAIGTGLRAIKPFLIFKLCTGQFIFFNIQTLCRTIYLSHWLWKNYWSHWGSDFLPKRNDSRKNVRYSALTDN